MLKIIQRNLIGLYEKREQPTNDEATQRTKLRGGGDALTAMLTCKTAYTELETTRQTSIFFTELKLKHGGFVRLNILLDEAAIAEKTKPITNLA